KRYKNLIGKKAKIPLFNFEVPIISDKSAEMEKGTGVLMICSYGDKYDVEAINRHKLQPRVILNQEGRINSGEYKGMSVKEARKKVLQDLKEKNLISEQKSISNFVNVHDKCGTEIEFLPTEQWFINILNKKKQMLEQGRKIKWHPDYMLKRYENWVNGLEWDWNISRDRHFGIPIPVWTCKKCNKTIAAEEKELPVDPLQTKKKCSCGETAEPEKKVLDTWATSSLTPQIGLSLVNDKINLPFSLRPQAHDIIRTWAFYTIVRSYLSEKEIPWSDIMISGFVTLQGEKMSKSKGNVIDPAEVLKKYSADALRFWAAGSSLGEDLDYQEKDILTGQKFITKLWNASKFAFMNLEGYKQEKPKNLEIMDKWIISKLNNLVKTCTGSFENYEFSRAKSETEIFFWHTFCDNYLEIIKKRIYEPASKEEKISAQYTLYQCLLAVLKLMAPIMPHITEELYQKYYKKNEKTKSIHLSKWPEFDKKLVDEKIEKIGDEFIDVLGKVRQYKTKNQKSLKAEIILTIEKEKMNVLKPVLKDLKAVTSSREIKEGSFAIEFI
ncbi:valine--tRNA ligase, partial [Candidatus Pacearchaeota archaeon CG06_land_8_20_14_3_00_35_12]